MGEAHFPREELGAESTGLSYQVLKPGNRSIEQTWEPSSGAPVFTSNGKYTSRGWTEWTQGFQFGSAILQFDATGDAEFLEIGRERTVDLMAPHVSHIGVHDHGFNNVSTYGNLLRLMSEGRIAARTLGAPLLRAGAEGLRRRAGGALVAHQRWRRLHLLFNGPHSLFVDTIRTLRALAVGHRLGHVLMGENDQQISLLDRAHRSTPAPPRKYASSTAKAATPTTSAAASRTRASSTPTTATTAAPVRSRATRPSPPGPAGWPGPCAASPSSWNSSTISDAELTPGGRDGRSRYGEGRRAPPAISTSTTHRRRWHSLLGHRRARSARSWATGAPPGRPVQRSRAGGQLGRRHRRPGPAAPRATALKERSRTGRPA